MAFNRLDGGVFPLHELRLSQATEVPFRSAPLSPSRFCAVCCIADPPSRCFRPPVRRLWARLRVPHPERDAACPISTG